MKLLLLFSGLALSLSLAAQYPSNSIKSRLGYQTTGDGLVYRGSGAPAYSPGTMFNAWMYLDTTNFVLYGYIGFQWQRLPLVNNGLNADGAYHQLGGSLVENTTVSTGTYDLIMGRTSGTNFAQISILNSGSGASFFNSYNSGAIEAEITAANGTSFLLVENVADGGNSSIYVNKDGFKADYLSPSLGVSYFRMDSTKFRLRGLVSYASHAAADAANTEYQMYKIDNSRAIYIKNSTVTSQDILGTGTADRSARWSATNTLAAGNLTDNGTKVQALLPFQFHTWTTAGRPTGVNGYIGYNTSFNWLDIYSSTGWFSPARAATTGGAFTAGYIPFGGTGGLTEDLGISWDNTNKGLSVKSNTTSNSRGIQVLQQTNDGIGAFNSQVKNRGSLANAVQNGDALGSFGFGGSDGAAYQFTATIQGRAVGSVSTNVVPTDLIFNTSATNTLSLTERMRITSAGNVGVTSGSFSITGMTTGSIFFSGASGLFTQDNSNLFWDNTNKRMLIGSATNNISQLSVTNSTSTTTTRGISIIQQTNDTVSALINLYKSRGTISNSVTNGDKVGSIAFSATDGGTYQQSLRMRAEIDGTVSTNNVPMALTFGNRLNNGVGFTERMRLTSGGNLLIGTQTDVSRTLHLNGEARITDLTTDTPTRIVGADADGDLGAITVGTGLSLSGGTLTATATADGNGIYTGSGTLSQHTTRALIPSTGNLFFSQRFNSNADSAYLNIVNYLGGERAVNFGLTDTSSTGYSRGFFESDGAGSMNWRFETNDVNGNTTVRALDGELDLITTAGNISLTAPVDQEVRIVGMVRAKQEGYYEINSTSSPQNLSNTYSDNFINQGGTQATFTLVFPASPEDGQILKITYNNNISTLTLDGNGNTIVGTTVTTAVEGSQRVFKFYAGEGVWIRQN